MNCDICPNADGLSLKESIVNICHDCLGELNDIIQDIGPLDMRERFAKMVKQAREDNMTRVLIEEGRMEEALLGLGYEFGDIATIIKRVFPETSVVAYHQAYTALDRAVLEIDWFNLHDSEVREILKKSELKN